MIYAMGNNVWVGIEAFGANTQNWMLTSTDGGATWSAQSVSGLGHVNGFIFSVATTDGVNVYAMWLEQKTPITWGVYVAYSSNGGSSWTTSNIGSSIGTVLKPGRIAYAAVSAIGSALGWPVIMTPPAVIYRALTGGPSANSRVFE